MRLPRGGAGAVDDGEGSRAPRAPAARARAPAPARCGILEVGWHQRRMRRNFRGHRCASASSVRAHCRDRLRVSAFKSARPADTVSNPSASCRCAAASAGARGGWVDAAQLAQRASRRDAPRASPAFADTRSNFAKFRRARAGDAGGRGFAQAPTPSASVGDRDGGVAFTTLAESTSRPSPRSVHAGEEALTLGCEPLLFSRDWFEAKDRQLKARLAREAAWRAEWEGKKAFARTSVRSARCGSKRSTRTSRHDHGGRAMGSMPTRRGR